MKLIILTLACALSLGGCASPQFVSTGDPIKDKALLAAKADRDAQLSFERKQTANAVARGLVRFFTGDLSSHKSVEEQVFGEDESFR